MPRVFQNDELKILFPENWYLSQSYEETAGIEYQVNLESPSGALWSLVACRGTDVAESLVAKTKSEMSKIYDLAEWTPIETSLFDRVLNGWEGNFFTLDLLVTTQILLLPTEGRTLFVQTQAESREFDELAKVFSAITISLLQSMAKPAD